LSIKIHEQKNYDFDVIRANKILFDELFKYSCDLKNRKDIVVSEYVFPNSRGERSSRKIYDSLIQFHEMIGVEYKNGFHSTRHTYGTQLAIMDYGDQKIQKIMRHKSNKMVSKYTHFVDKDELRKDVALEFSYGGKIVPFGKKVL